MTRAHSILTRRQNGASLALLLASAALVALPDLAHAQALPDINGKATAFSAWLIGAGLAVLTAAVAYTGFKTLARGVQFEQVEKLFWGGVFIGSAAILAAFFFGG
jgi:type IV secretion system protein VirB2